MTVPSTQPAAPASSRTWSRVGAAGELLITLGAVVLLYVVYQLWWTNVVAGREAHHVASVLRQDWQEPPPAASAPGGTVTEPDFAEAFALMYVPRLKDKVWALPILGTVQMADLARGVGHYPDSQLPGEKGNFAVAGHRATHGEPFRDVDQVKVGDEVVVETRDTWFVYRLTRTRIVQPHETWVVDPVPGEPGATPTQRMITITTCNPRWASYERWIWWGVQTDAVSKATGDVPEALREGG